MIGIVRPVKYSNVMDAVDAGQIHPPGRGPMVIF